MNIFYNSEINLENKNFILSGNEHLHISKVLRKKTNDKIYITNGKGYLFETIIDRINSKAISLKILDYKYKPPMDYNLNIGIAPTKKIDRFEWFVEKAVEIGVSAITPIICAHSERKKLNYSRLNKIAVSAMKQSLQTYLPKINPIVKVEDFISLNTANQNYIAHCKRSKTQYLSNIIVKNSCSSVIIGPEGGFTDNEINLALDFNFKAVSLGDNRLRTETAGTVCCQMFLDSNK